MYLWLWDIYALSQWLYFTFFFVDILSKYWELFVFCRQVWVSFIYLVLLLILCITFYLCFEMYLKTSAYHERDTGVRLVILWKGEWKSPDLNAKNVVTVVLMTDDFWMWNSLVVNHFIVLAFLCHCMWFFFLSVT